MLYDGFLYGNGLSINLISQLKQFINPQKHYLLNINDFIKSFINGQLNHREEIRIFKLFYKSDDTTNRKYYRLLKDAVMKYYMKHDANIEYWLGLDLFSVNCGYDMANIKNIIPSLYNIWHEILFDYIILCRIN